MCEIEIQTMGRKTAKKLPDFPEKADTEKQNKTNTRPLFHHDTHCKTRPPLLLSVLNTRPSVLKSILLISYETYRRFKHVLINVAACFVICNV